MISHSLLRINRAMSLLFVVSSPFPFPRSPFPLPSFPPLPVRSPLPFQANAREADAFRGPHLAHRELVFRLRASSAVNEPAPAANPFLVAREHGVAVTTGHGLRNALFPLPHDGAYESTIRVHPALNYHDSVDGYI